MVALLWLATAFAALAQPTTPGPGARILTAEELRQAGLTRLGDLFRVLDDWDAASIEGYTWQASAAGLAPLQHATWTLLVDGQPIALGLLDTPVLDMLPLPMSEVAYVEVIHRPALVAGVVAPAGVIHLHTRTPDDGVALDGVVSAANEVDDPGPYRYTDLATPNIDRIGPTYEVATSYAGDAVQARAFLKADEHHATDEQIEERVRTLYRGLKKPRLLLAAPGLDLRLDRLGQHHLYAGFARLQDLRFIEPLGLEVPTDHRYYHLGLTGDVAPQRTSSLHYRLSYAVSDLDPRPSAGGIEVHLRQDRLRGNAEARIGTNEYGGHLGLSVDHLRTITFPVLDAPSLFVPLLYGRLYARPGERFQGHLTGFIDLADAQLGQGALLTVETQPHAAHTLALSVSAMRRPYATTNSLWFWMARGFRLPTSPSVDLPPAFPASTTYTVDVAWTLHPTDRFRLMLAGGYRRFLNQTVARYDLRFVADSVHFETTTDVHGFSAGEAWLGRAEIHVAYTPTLSQRFFYRYLRYPADDAAFFRAWRSLPWHHASTTLRLVPSPRFSLYARLGMRSDARWADYGRIAATTDGRYPETLPSFWLLDLTAQKRLWKDHLRVSLSLRNFLDEDVRWHPAGEIQQIVFHVALEAHFGTAW